MDIEIPRDVAESQGVPTDLDSGLEQPFTFPNPRRRRISGVIYLLGALVAAAGVMVGDWPRAWGVAAVLVVIGGYHFLSAWDLGVSDAEALTRAGGAVGYPVGHASAGVGFSGWRARPVWNVIVYSAEEPPSRRSLVQIDGVDGQVLGVAEEPLG